MTPRLKTAHINGLRLLVHLASLGFLLWLGYAVPAGLLGGDPVQGLTHYLGKGALHLLLLTLLVSPLAKRWRQGQLIKLRRPLGLWCCGLGRCLHFMVWLGLDLQFDWGLIGGELVKRSYIVVGAWWRLLLLLALSITSIPALLRRMGPAWQKLHNWIYAVALLVPVHYWWSVKSGWQEPLIYLLLAGGSAVAAAREAAASLAPAPAATPETERGLIGLFFGDLSAVGIDLQVHPPIVGIQGFHLEFVPFQLDFPNVVVPLGQQQLDQCRHVETRLSRPAKGGKKAEDQQDTAWDHIHSGFMAGTL